MKFKPLALVLVLAVFSIAAKDDEYREMRELAAAHGPMEQYGATGKLIAQDVSYMPSRPQDLDFFLDVYASPHEGLQPVIVVIHGGSWINGTKENYNKVFNSKYLAGNGYVVFSINYRTLPEVRLKKQAEDCMAAVIWVKQHAKEYGGDPKRVGLLGGSAGGHLGALVAWASDDPWFKPTGYDGPLDSDVLAACLYYPVIDLDRTFRDNASFLGPAVLAPIAIRRFETYHQSLKHLSPVYHIDGKAPPTLFLTGDRDELKLYPHSVEFSRKLREAGVNSEVYAAPGKDHAFTAQYWEPEAIESARRTVEWFDRYLR